METREKKKPTKVSLILMQLHFPPPWLTIEREFKPPSLFFGRHLKLKDPVSSQLGDVRGRSICEVLGVGGRGST